MYFDRWLKMLQKIHVQNKCEINSYTNKHYCQFGL